MQICILLDTCQTVALNSASRSACVLVLVLLVVYLSSSANIPVMSMCWVNVCCSFPGYISDRMGLPSCFTAACGNSAASPAVHDYPACLQAWTSPFPLVYPSDLAFSPLLVMHSPPSPAQTASALPVYVAQRLQYLDQLVCCMQMPSTCLFYHEHTG